MTSVCHLLHIEPAYWHARHYAGIVLDGDVDRRLAQHLSGQGSPLVRAAVAAGRTVRLVLTALGDRRRLERRWKNRHGTRICPECRHQPTPRPRQLKLSIRTNREGRGRRPSSTPLWRLRHDRR